MSETTQRNDFLLDLLALQQDGKQAISVPANWTTQNPLLEVPTETDKIVGELGRALLRGDDRNEVARWHFFVGSPGNGKSAAMGKLCRHLMTERSCRILDEHDVSIDKLESTTIPYELRVFERENRFATALIVQDASVVRNPFAADVDPASELVATIKEAWEKGTSLVVCTNRGVIEKAYRVRYLDREFNSKPWFKVLRQLIENGDPTLDGDLGEDWAFEGRKCVFLKTRVTYSYLDNQSLVLGSNILDELIRKATGGDHWIVCSNCDVASLCPFKANRDWIVDDTARARFLGILRRAEALSGQILVFREALAFLSLVLAGCSRDYVHVHPCEWVHAKVKETDLFALAMRRIYMSTFAAAGQYGLETDESLCRRQRNALSFLRAFVEDSNCEAAVSLDTVLNGKPPSTDVGVGRLTGTHGILKEIDPWHECLPSGFLDDWDGDLAALALRGHPFFTEIEKRCIEVLAYLEELIESTPSHEAPNCHWALRRWSSNFLIHFGGVIEGHTSWAKELDEFIGILETIGKHPMERTTGEKRRIRELDRQLEELLSGRTAEDGRRDIVPLSDSVTLRGRWVANKLTPRIDISRKSASLSITVTFQSGEIAALSARAFLWLNRHLRGRLDKRCFPLELLTGIVDARIRAAARGDSAYAFSNDDVELVVNAGDKESFTLSRFDGDVHVEHNQ